MFTFTDLAIYPVLFTQYLSFFYPEAIQYKIPICLLIIWLSAGLNLLGIVPVGRSSLMLGFAVLVPFGILFAVALVNGVSFSLPAISSRIGELDFTIFGMGLYTVMWNFLGWDNSSSFVEEVYRPVQSYLVSIVVAFFLILGMYFFSIWTGFAAGIEAKVLTEHGFPSPGLHVGGWWLGAVLSLGGMASALGLFLSILLAISRIPKAMADDGLLPLILRKTHPTRKVPHISITICALVVSGMVFWEFGDLLIIDVTLYGVALLLEFIALIMLRIRKPEAERPFRVPLNATGLILMTALPIACLVVAITASLSEIGPYTNATLFAIAAVLTAPIAWKITGMRHRRQPR